MKQDSMILKQLSIGYHSKRQNRVLVSGMNASLQAGELTTLIGSNGAGKSTLLRTLAGFQKPLSGEILLYDSSEDWMDGMEAEARYCSLDQFSVKNLAKKIAVVLTVAPAVTSIRVDELVGMGRSPYTRFWGGLSSADKKIVDEAMQWVGIDNLKNRMFHTLSDGERQKVMIAKALAQQTDMILLDEPTAFLDYPSKVELLQLLSRLAHDLGKAILLSTHDLELALQLSDTLWLLDSGLHVGSPRQLADKKALSSFIERAGISFDKETLVIRVKR